MVREGHVEPSQLLRVCGILLDDRLRYHLSSGFIVLLVGFVHDKTCNSLDNTSALVVTAEAHKKRNALHTRWVSDCDWDKGWTIVRATIREIVEYRSMLWSMILSELRTRYKGSFLGFLWTFINPLLMIIIYSLVFSLVMRVNIRHYAAFVSIGVLSWNMFATSLQSSSSVIVSKSSLVKKIYFPREILPMSVVGGALINYLLSYIILVPFILLSGIAPTPMWAAIPVIIFVNLMLTLGLSLLCAALNVYFRDLEHMLGIFLMAWFYLTPVVYSYTMVPHQLVTVFKLNPVGATTILLQDLLYYGHDIRWKLFIYAVAVSAAILGFGWGVFHKLSRGFAEEV